jgi:malonate-semialdehyde dehydrogenase (acetylating)/methylmalonate-semialdehyde dehydrogenase
VQALGGAKNHAIVLEDASLEQTSNAIIGAAYGSAGERCMAISVVVAVEGVADELCKLLSEKAAALKIGPGNEAENEMGPLITNEHKNKVIDYIQQGIESGATILLDGREHDVTNKPGFFLGPTLFDDVSPEMSIYKEEIFGPVLVVLRVKDFNAAIRLANEHQFGNGVAIFTNQGSKAREFVHSVEVGMVGINVAIPVPLSFYTFGGWKDSIFGSSNIYGMDGIRFFTRTKTVTARWVEDDGSINLSMPTIK